jgi:pilus assembly protein CpaC
MKFSKSPSSQRILTWTSGLLFVSLASTVLGIGVARDARSADGEPKHEETKRDEAKHDELKPEDAFSPEDAGTDKLSVTGGKKSAKRSRLTSDLSEDEADRRRLLLTTGEDKTVDLDFDANTRAEGITVGNPLLVATTLVKVGDKRQIVFKPLKAGETNVIVRDADGNIRLIFMVRITGSNLLRIAGEVRDLLRDVEGIDIRIVGPKIILEGEVLVPADYGRVAMVVTDAAYSGYVMNLTTLSPLGMQVLAKRIETDIKNFAPNVTTRVVNGVIFLEGSVKNADEARRADQIARIYLPEMRPTTLIERDDKTSRGPQVPRQMIQNFIQIEPPAPRKQEKLVRVTVHFVELSKDYSKFFGFKWEPGFTSEPSIAIGQGATGATQAGGISFSATISSLIPKLKTAQDAGYARVLKTGTVIVRSGQPAKLDELTQFPFVVAGANGQVTPGQQPVGLSVGVTPLILGQSEDIQMDLNMNQISLVSLSGAGQAPVTATHKVETKIYVKSKESAAVAAVNSTDVGTSFNKDDPNPGSFNTNANGTQTDAMFTLKHTKNYAKKKSQFVIFVTPEIIDNASEGSDDLKRNFRVKVK